MLLEFLKECNIEVIEDPPTVRAVIPLTKNKKCAKYNSSRPIVLDRTFLYADTGSTSEYACLWNNKNDENAYACTSSYFISRINALVFTLGDFWLFPALKKTLREYAISL